MTPYTVTTLASDNHEHVTSARALLVYPQQNRRYDCGTHACGTHACATYTCRTHARATHARATISCGTIALCPAQQHGPP
eukprot:7769376-Pyramimonas_sp.AAC.1